MSFIVEDESLFPKYLTCAKMNIIIIQRVVNDLGHV